LAKSTPPPLRFLFSHPAHFIACGFGSGLSPFAPGTAGTLFAWLTFPLLRPWMNDAELLGLLLICFIGGVLAAHKTGADLGVVDHGSIVWDEIVPFWMVLVFCPSDWLWQTAAFFLFRFFDIVKPQPARFFDEKVKNGFGVMADDLIAAGYTVLVLAILRFALG
jgi:phosphatidylglycerophosphatase A